MALQETLRNSGAGSVNAFEWSAEQCHALDAIHNWRIAPHDQLFRFLGYAGTGKTTVTKEIARQAGGNVLFAAFTGKACLVMQKMGCDGARTIHSAIYQPRSELIAEAKELRKWLENPVEQEAATRRWGTADPPTLEKKLAALRESIEAGPEWILRERIAPKPDIIVIDECSMVNEELALDLMSFEIPIIVIGDPGQLPPVKGAGFFTAAEPDAMLTEVHRFALENPITRMATTVRTDGARRLRLGAYGASRYLSQPLAGATDLLLAADQVLCGTHKTRHACNAAIREALGHSGNIPMPGEKLLCCRNDKVLSLLNGSMWRVIECEPEHRDLLRAKIVSWEGDGAEKDVVMHADPFVGREVMPEDKFDAQEFTFGYAITVHKAQGSQWPHVAIINDGFGMWQGNGLHDRWIYTGITRAQDRLTIIRP